MQVLLGPLVQHPDHGPSLRQAIAARIQRTSRAVPGDCALPAALTRHVLQALDLRYGWLSDHAAFHRDFGRDWPLSHSMLLRAYPEQMQVVDLAPAPAAPARGRLERALDRLFQTGVRTYATIILILFWFMQVGAWLHSSALQRPVLEAMALGLLLLTMAYGHAKLRHHLSPGPALFWTLWLGTAPVILYLGPTTGPDYFGHPLFMLWILATVLVMVIHQTIWPWLRRKG